MTTNIFASDEEVPDQQEPTILLSPSSNQQDANVASWYYRSADSYTKRLATAHSRNEYLKTVPPVAGEKKKADTLLKLGGARNKLAKQHQLLDDWVYINGFPYVNDKGKTVTNVFLGPSIAGPIASVEATLAKLYPEYNFDFWLETAYTYESLQDPAKLAQYEARVAKVNSRRFMDRRFMEYMLAGYNGLSVNRFFPGLKPGQNAYAYLVLANDNLQFDLTPKTLRLKLSDRNAEKETLIPKIIQAVRDNQDGIIHSLININNSDNGKLISTKSLSNNFAYNPTAPNVPIASNSVERYNTTVDRYFAYLNPNNAAKATADANAAKAAFLQYFERWINNTNVSVEATGLASPQGSPAPSPPGSPRIRPMSPRASSSLMSPSAESGI